MTTTIWPGAWAPEVRPARPAVASLYESAFATMYDGLATFWDRTLARRADAGLLAYLARLPDRPLRLLDVGCGTGRNLDRLRRAGARVADHRGIDGSHTVLQTASSRHAGRPARFEHVRDLESMRTLVPDGDRYDLVLCTWVLSHLRDPARLLTMAREAAGADAQVLVGALTDTAHPVGAAGARRYERHLHAGPIPASVLSSQRPIVLATQLLGLTTVAGFPGSGG